MNNTARTIYHNTNTRQTGTRSTPPTFEAVPLSNGRIGARKLALGGSIETITGRRVNWVRVVITLLLVTALLVVGFVLTAGRVGKAHGQGIVSPSPWCQISAPRLETMAGGCMEAKIYIPGW
jgi:hypothetical protein